MKLKKKDSNNLIKVCNVIEQNIEKKGLERYDRVQIRFLPFFQKQKKLYVFLRKCIGIFDIYIPISTRKLLQMPKIKLPTAYTHLGNAYLLAEKNKINFVKKNNSINIIEQGIKEYLSIEKGDFWWNYEKNEYFYPNKDQYWKRPTMHMHGLARFNILLLEASDYYQIERYKEIAIGSLYTTIKHHNINYYDDDKAYISYFYNSNDCTLNINTEFLHWISLIPIDRSNKEIHYLANCILNLVIKEQKKSGAWHYYSYEHDKRYKTNGIPDCHHMGTMIYNLLNVSKSEAFFNKKKEIAKTCNKAMLYYIKTFFNNNNGKAIVYADRKREAGPVQYSEAIFAFIEYIYSDNTDCKIKAIILDILPKVINNLVKLVNLKDGSVPSEKILFKWCNMDSVRWGNGPVIQAILMYIALLNEGALG